MFISRTKHRHSASRTVYTVDRASNAKVAVVSGGGAGHEPAHVGYTGRGLLTACVSGEIFASPTANQILNTIRLAAFGSDLDVNSVGDKRDVLVIMNNYTGDRLNFGLAIEKARVMFPRIRISSVVVADDVSLLRSPVAQTVGPRGLAGNILVCKLLGALAHTGASLSTLKIYGDAVAGNISSIGVALEHCHVPGREQGPRLDDGECEVGLGLHNEPGGYRRKMEDDIQGLVVQMVQMMLDRDGPSAKFAAKEDETILFVNNLGGVSQLEMGAFLHDLVDVLGAVSIPLYLTSLHSSIQLPI